MSELEIRDYLDGQAVFFAGTANSIMQLGLPPVGYGVYESKVDSGNVMKVPKKRLRTTVTYLAVAMLGTDAERTAYRRAVDSVHRFVRSDDSSPVKYNAFSRDLQLWVAACLYFGARDFHDQLYGPMDDEAADWFYLEASRLGTTLQVRPEDWPADREAFELYWKQALERVSYDETLTTYLIGLLDLKQLSPKQRARYSRRHRLMNTGFLPPEFREALGLSWTPQDEAKFRSILSRTARRNRRVPRLLRNFPVNYFLWDFRVRRALGRPLV